MESSASNLHSDLDFARLACGPFRLNATFARLKIGPDNTQAAINLGARCIYVRPNESWRDTRHAHDLRQGNHGSAASHEAPRGGSLETKIKSARSRGIITSAPPPSLLSVSWIVDEMLRSIRIPAEGKCLAAQRRLRHVGARSDRPALPWTKALIP